MQDTYHGVCCVVTVGEGLAACPGHSSRCCPAAAASLPAAARRAGWAGRTPGPSSALGPRRRQARHSAVRSKLATARGSLGRETRAGAPGCSAASLGGSAELGSVCCTAMCGGGGVVTDVVWSLWCHKCHCAECRGWCEAAWWRPTEAAGTSLSQQ